MEDWDGNTAWAEYQEFAVKGNKYELHFTSYKNTSTAGDSLTARHNGKAFTTKDQDNDLRNVGNCAQIFHGAWWSEHCQKSNLNGKYYQRMQANTIHNRGVLWKTWKGDRYSLKGCSMKIREYF